MVHCSPRLRTSLTDELIACRCISMSLMASVGGRLSLLSSSFRRNSHPAIFSLRRDEIPQERPARTFLCRPSVIFIFFFSFLLFMLSLRLLPSGPRERERAREEGRQKEKEIYIHRERIMLALVMLSVSVILYTNILCMMTLDEVEYSRWNTKRKQKAVRFFRALVTNLLRRHALTENTLFRWR